MALTIFWGALAVFAVCVAWFGWANVRSWFGRRADDAAVAVDDLDAKFKPEWGDADIWVNRSRNLWPSLQSNPFFWAGCSTSTMICVLGILGAQALGQGVLTLTILWMGIFCVANLVQAAIAVLGDNGRGEWYEFQSGDRPTWHWPVLIVLMFVNFVASITGSSNVAEVLTTTSEINVSSLESRRAELKRAQTDLDRLRTARIQDAPGDSAEGIQAKATELEAAAEREAGRGGCGSKCEAIKRDAIKWRALANNAIRERELGEKIAVMRAEISGTAADGTARTVASPHAHLIEEATGGSVSERQVNTYLAPLFWLLIAVVDLALWLWAGDYGGRYRMEQYRARAEAANAWLTNAGLPARYTINSDGEVTDIKAISGPDAGPGDTINIDLSESAAAKIAKSPRLQHIQALFDSVLIEADGTKIPVGRAYEIFAKIRSEQGERQYMNPADFRQAMTAYCELVGVQLISNQIIGYKVGVAQHAEAAE